MLKEKTTKGIRIDLSRLWRKNVKNIMTTMNFSQESIAMETGLKRSSIATMLTRKDFHLTGIQFLGTLRVLEEMIRRSGIDPLRKNAARKYLEELNDDYRKNGLY